MSISLRTLFGVVAFSAVATAVLLRPTFLVAGTVLSITLLILGTAIVGACYSIGPSRAFCVGFAFFGSAHLICALGPWFEDTTGEFILTRQILDQIGATLEYNVVDTKTMPGVWKWLSFAREPSANSTYPYLAYVVAGQSLFTLIVAYLGGVVARMFYQRRSTDTPQ